MFSASASILSIRMIIETFTANTSWVCPAGVTKLASVSGYGARGTNSTQVTTTTWGLWKVRTLYRWDGGTDVVFNATISSGSGNPPGGPYCDTLESYSGDPTYNFAQNCYHYETSTSTTGSPATTGSSTTGLTKTFPGALGNVAPAVTTFTNIAVVPATSYTLTVPTGGSITLTYYK